MNKNKALYYLFWGILILSFIPSVYYILEVKLVLGRDATGAMVDGLGRKLTVKPWFFRLYPFSEKYWVGYKVFFLESITGWIEVFIWIKLVKLIRKYGDKKDKEELKEIK